MTDTAARERASALFAPIAEAYLRRPGVDIGPMFGSEGLRIRGKVFAFVGYEGALIVKVPAARATVLVAEGTATPVTMRERTMREWVQIGAERVEEWEPIVAEAFAYVDDLTP